MKKSQKKKSTLSSGSKPGLAEVYKERRGYPPECFLLSVNNYKDLTAKRLSFPVVPPKRYYQLARN